MDPARRRRSFFLPFEAIRPLAPGRGLSFATDRITVEGHPVGFMYREQPDHPNDSGWRFMAGDESREYINDPDNWALYDVNVIANYDRDTIPFLDFPIGTAYQRHPEHRCFRSVAYPEPAEENA